MQSRHGGVGLPADNADEPDDSSDGGSDDKLTHRLLPFGYIEPAPAQSHRSAGAASGFSAWTTVSANASIKPA
jgi:hypothetical protein